MNASLQETSLLSLALGRLSLGPMTLGLLTMWAFASCVDSRDRSQIETKGLPRSPRRLEESLVALQGAAYDAWVESISTRQSTSPLAFSAPAPAQLLLSLQAPLEASIERARSGQEPLGFPEGAYAESIRNSGEVDLGCMESALARLDKLRRGGRSYEEVLLSAVDLLGALNGCREADLIAATKRHLLQFALNAAPFYLVLPFHSGMASDDEFWTRARALPLCLLQIVTTAVVFPSGLTWSPLYFAAHDLDHCDKMWAHDVGWMMQPTSLGGLVRDEWLGARAFRPWRYPPSPAFSESIRWWKGTDVQSGLIADDAQLPLALLGKEDFLALVQRRNAMWNAALDARVAGRSELWPIFSERVHEYAGAVHIPSAGEREGPCVPEGEAIPLTNIDGYKQWHLDCSRSTCLVVGKDVSSPLGHEVWAPAGQGLGQWPAK